MGRRVLNLLSGLSLLAMSAFIAGWGRSCRVQDAFAWRRAYQTPTHVVSVDYELRTYRGGFYLDRYIHGFPRATFTPSDVGPPPTGWRHGPAAPSYLFPRDPMTPWNRLGFVFEHDFVPGRWGTFGDGTLCAIPFWAPTLAASLLPLVRLVRRLRQRRRRPAISCPACGYDLRATPDRCPECGATPAPADSSMARSTRRERRPGTHPAVGCTDQHEARAS